MGRNATAALVHEVAEDKQLSGALCRHARLDLLGAGMLDRGRQFGRHWLRASRSHLGRARGGTRARP